MKKLVTVLSLIFTFINFSSAQEYSIFKVDGKVLVLSHQSSVWKPAQKHDTISRSDKVRLSSGSSLSIVEVATNRIITSSKAGEYNVVDFSKKASEKSESIFRSLNKKLVRDIKKESELKNHYSTYGATTRGIHDNADYADSLYVAIYNAINTAQPVISNPVSFRKITTSPETFCFGVENHSEETIFINVIKVSEAGATFCFSFPYDDFGVLPIPAHSSADLSGYPFIESSEKCRYLLVSTNHPYRISSLQYLLTTMKKPEYDTPADSTYIIEF